MAMPRTLRLMAALAGLACTSVVGCAPIMYYVNALEGTQAVEEARRAGADRLDPYNFYYAQAHLVKAREEANAGEYQFATQFAQTAASSGREARDTAQRRAQESGR